jgi:protein-L-isoaspartate O-methyltransferase
MASESRQTNYLLGSSDAEHERLIRQAIRLAPVSERFFREAGIANGHRVLELGSGVGDVAMLLARLVGPSGNVVAIECDTRSVDRARTRAAAGSLHNIEFVETDIAQFSSDASFDAAVGRFILQFLPDPVAVLRSLSQRGSARRRHRIPTAILGALSCALRSLATLVSSGVAAP